MMRLAIGGCRTGFVAVIAGCDHHRSRSSALDGLWPAAHPESVSPVPAAAVATLAARYSWSSTPVSGVRRLLLLRRSPHQEGADEALKPDASTRRGDARHRHARRGRRRQRLGEREGALTMDLALVCAASSRWASSSTSCSTASISASACCSSWRPDDQRRATMMNTVAPVWDGNETWLVLGGIGLFAIFPLLACSLSSSHRRDAAGLLFAASPLSFGFAPDVGSGAGSRLRRR